MTDPGTALSVNETKSAALAVEPIQPLHTVTKQLIPDILLYHCEYHRKPIPEHGNDKVESPSLFPDAWMLVNEFLGQIHLPRFNGLPNIRFMGWPKSQMKNSLVLQLLRGEINIETKACKS